MWERINRLAKGFVEYGVGKLKFSEEELVETIIAGKKEQRQFEIYNEESIPVKGLVYSTDRRVRVSEQPFFGNTWRIPYEVDATREELGTFIEGAFQIISNQGEYTLPYLFQVTGTGSMYPREIDTLQDFVRFAQTDRDQALRLFDSEEFRHLAFMEDPAVYTRYDGLILRGSKRNALEEFLCALDCKDPVRVSIEEKERGFQSECMPEQDRIVIEKNTWGYLRLEITVDGEFLVPEKNVITEEDFSDNRAFITYRFAPGRLHSGWNLGSIHVDSPMQSFVIPVSVFQEPDEPFSNSHENCVAYGTQYLNLLMGEGNEKAILTEMENILLSQKEEESETFMSEFSALFLAEVYLLQGKREPAGQLLDAAANVIELGEGSSDDFFSYYQYVRAMFSGNKEEKDKMLRSLNLLADNPVTASDLVMLLLFRLDPVLKENPSLLLTQMKTQFRRGCRSPLLYLGACQIFNVHPELLRVMDSFELQVLWFGARRKRINSRLARMIAALAQQEREFRPLYFKMLEKLYLQFQDNEILSGICTILMRGDRRDTAAFFWYDKGVEKDIRLTRLYEYYIYAFPDTFQGEVPRRVLLYFSYNNTLDTVSKAKLYAYLLGREDSRMQSETLFARDMEDFTREQILLGHISPNLARLYQNVLYPQTLDEKMVQMLPRILYAKRYVCRSPRIRYLVLCFPEKKEETVMALRGGKTYVPVYLPGVQIFTQDAEGNRYQSIPVEEEKLMDSSEMLAICKEQCKDHPMLRLAELSKGLENNEITAEWVEEALAMCEKDECHPFFAHRLTSRLLHYYKEHPEDTTALPFLLRLNSSELSAEDRRIQLEMLIALDDFKRAYDRVQKVGFGEICTESLRELCSRMILTKNMEKESALLNMAFACFSAGEIDAVIMQYLARYYNGSSKDMYRVLEAAQNVHAETYDLEERLLGQMLFSGEEEHLDDTFRAYAGKASCNETLVNAYLVGKSYRYFVKDEPIDGELVRYMKNRLIEVGNLTYLPQVCLMALTLYDSRQETLSAEDRELCRDMIDELYRKNYIFKYYQDCARFVRLPDELCDKILIEYRGEKAGHLQIQTRISSGGQETMIQTMPHMYEGIFVQMATVFYGETLEYEILDCNEGGKVVAQASVSYTGQERFGQTSRIGMLNCILKNMEGNDSTRLQKSLVDYGTMEELVKELFKPV